MKLYNCKVRLHGDVRDECRKKNVTAGEIRLLQQIHGEDAVLEVTPIGKDALSDNPSREGEIRSETEERDRLALIYGELPVAKMFGVKPVDISAEIIHDESPEEPIPDPVTGETLVARPGLTFAPPQKRGPGRPPRVGDLVA